ncbi:MAG: spore maturation protein [Endomicrobia bacterium]|nr:spore maturation protein [Endomicrobiia bacterium]
MNIVWLILLSIGIVFSIITGKTEEFTKSLFDATKSAVEVTLYLLGIVSLWLGITKIIEDSGLINHISKTFQPFVSRLFKTIPKNHSAITSITLNFLANIFGLGNAATPLGIKAMHDLQSINKDQQTVSFEMMLFIVINTASIQLVPFTTVGILSQFGSKSPNSIVMPTIIATIISAVIAVFNLYIFKKLFDKN